MKRKINYSLYLIFLILLTLISCQDEIIDISSSNESEVLQSNSQLVNFISNVTANDGSVDDVLDGSSCFSIQLPVTVSANNITIVIEDEVDIQQLEELLNSFDVELDFLFPITIILNDYSEIVLENEDQLFNLIDGCADFDDDIIDCVDFVYPLSFSVFDIDFNLVETLIIQDDEALYDFLESLEEDANLIVSINYPLPLVYSNGEILEINSNDELVSAIEAAQDNCYNEVEECSIDEASDALLECPWNINYEGEEFENYQIVFHESGDLQILNGDTAVAIGGLWNLITADNGLILNLSYLTAFQDSLGGEWLIVNCNNNALTLTRGNDVLELDKQCENVFDCFSDFELESCANDVGEAIFDLVQNTVGLIDCPYEYEASFHPSLTDAENDESYIYNPENFGSVNGQVYLRIVASNGLFEVYTIYLNPVDCNYFECFGDFNLAVCDGADGNEDGFGIFDLNLIFDNCPNDDVEYSFYLTIEDAESETNVLVSPFINTITNEQTIYSRVALASDSNIYEIFEHHLMVENCNNNCDVQDVNNYLIECIWNITSYNGSDNLMNWNFDFESNSDIVVIYTDTETIDATWTTTETNEGVIINFSSVSGPNIQAITGEWLIVECENERLQLHRQNDILVLERNCD